MLVHNDVRRPTPSPAAPALRLNALDACCVGCCVGCGDARPVEAPSSVAAGVLSDCEVVGQTASAISVSEEAVAAVKSWVVRGDK